ncbi:EamA family transporter RarD [Cellulomonas sp. ES6]|uniref:EamA family transporter RarD n=1 Tax=Cellulomonas sp. ES6 TaxID=3039384 RepID=UPI0024B645AB|nr:EamA family transporter RarD [Cellulomonas sp. ES6]WHP19150.1 EamA family transporter RarD [Cellulomonas sp. ES6]
MTTPSPAAGAAPSTTAAASGPVPPPTSAPAALDPRGLAAGAGAYLLWGVLPLYFELLKPSAATEIVAHRVLWSLVFCAVVLSVTRTWRALGVVLRSGRTLALIAAAAVLLAVNWLTFVFSALSGHVVDAALGYFINPLVTVLLAVLVLRERLRRLQWVALGFGVAAVVVITLGLGRLPWVALTLAGSFGLYGLLKNRVGRSVAAAPGLAAETLVLAPASAVYLVWLQGTGDATFSADGTWHALALAGTGIATALPLLLFGEAARRLPLSVVGSLQYLAPVLQLVIGVLVLHETMPPARWWGFGLVWVALVLLTVDGVRARRATVLRLADVAGR